MREVNEIKKALLLCPGNSVDCEQDMCPYWEIRLCVPELHSDVLELLKTQQPEKEPQNFLIPTWRTDSETDYSNYP